MKTKKHSSVSPKLRNKEAKIIVVASGYFDPIHSGHIRYLEKARNFGDKLIVIVNNDVQAKLKKKHPFMKLKERKEIVGALRCVDEVFISIDKDATINKSLRKLNPDIFAKGVDRNLKNIPEKNVCDELGIKIVYGLAGGLLKSPAFKQSSSKILKSYVKKKKCKKCGGKVHHG